MVKNDVKKIVSVFTGGTGGHVFPALSLIEELVERGYFVHIFVDKRRGFGLLSNNLNSVLLDRVKIHVLRIDNVRGNKFIGFCRQFFDLCYDIAYCCFCLLKYKIRLNICFGGFFSVPGVVASFLCFRKLILQEQNAVISTVNKFGLLFANYCCLGFENTMGIFKITKDKCLYTGNPIRSKVLNLHYQNDNSAIRYVPFFKVYDRINLLITGGSQGSGVFVDVIVEMLKFLPPQVKDKLYVYHQCRVVDVEVLNEHYKDLGVKHEVKVFFDNMSEIMASCHMMISRSGYTVSEISVLGVPSILVPMKNAKNNHQYYNAKYMRDNGAAIMIEESNFNAQNLCNILCSFTLKDYLLSEMSSNAKNIAVVDASKKVAYVVDFLLGFNENLNVSSSFKRHFDEIRTIKDNVGLG
ncbi:MAG: UDP-N-acetylglucosamine--N-acetylmuramyl-(pentapeptide) pyrophosphoryl-undecaprenol [Pseudomonadota bacterium]|jgi:UDP-N-acetylglucosamine--N-acetylmuramyl-(pentapeptide) pyrophosphoryl-undecaprenol N-acetylglucosamine transferase